MKKILTFLIALFSVGFLFQNHVNSFTIQSNQNNVIVTPATEKIPYCDGNNCGLDKGIEEAKKHITGIEKNKEASTYIQDIILYVLGFLFFVTVLIIIWAGVTILMSAGNDDKVESAKKIIINCVIGICLIFLAYPITRFVVGVFDKAKTDQITQTTP